MFRLSYGIIGNGVGEILLIRGKGINCRGGGGGGGGWGGGPELYSSSL